MLAIAIFGGEAIRGLAVALILGIVIGTYASIFIATPIMYDLSRKSEKRKAKKAAQKAATAENKE
jgi:SecD/SecF fusion protein